MRKFLPFYKRLFTMICAFSLLIFAIPVNAAKQANYNTNHQGYIFNEYDGLDSFEINAITQTPDGYIWAGGYSGLYRYNGLQYVLMDFDTRLGNIVSLFCDSSGLLWIGTNTNGLGCYDLETGQIKFFTQKDGLRSNAIRSICEDDDGNIYVGTSSYLIMI